MQQLSQECFALARRFIFEQGRAVDQALFRYHFEEGPADAVWQAVASYQNEDGGLGHALEPDLRTASSSAIATSTGLSILKAVGTPANHPIITEIVGYLMSTLDIEARVWPIIPPNIDDAPHAPWWDYAESSNSFGAFKINPRASILGHLYHFAEALPADFLKTMTASTEEAIDALPAEIDMFDMFSMMSLATAPGVPPSTVAYIQSRLIQALPHTLQMDQAKWHEYGLLPVEAAPAPDAMLANAIDSALIDTNLDYYIQTQEENGSWALRWSWEFVDAAAWAAAEAEWRGHHAIEILLALRAYGRLA